MLKPKIAPTSLNVSDKVQDLSIIHAINLERLKQSEVVKVLDILDDLGLSIQKQLEKIDPTGVGPTYRARRLAKLLENVKATTKAHFSKAKAANSKGLSGVASISAKATQNIINGSLGVSLGAALPSAANLQSLAGKVLIEGDVVSEYWKQQNAQVTGNFLRQMRMGVAGGEGLQSLIQRVRGTKENNFTDGIMNATKKKAETLVRSSVAAVNNEAIINTYQANEDLFNGYQWLATLDSRTSDICKARSGLTWDMNFKPIGHGIGWSPPPAHFNCRSTVIGVLKPWADLANKPLPAVGAETLKEELTKSLMARGLSPALISKAINKTQQSMDGFVAGDINFEDWLKGKSERFQKAILGEQKWELWNNGKIGFVDLVDQKSNPRSIAELQALVDAGRTAPLKANKAAKEAAKQQAEAAALAAKAAEKAENAAQAQIDEIASGAGGANKKKVYDKLKKDGINGLSATQIMAKVDEGVAQINITANIAKAKKKLKDGKPLSKTEDAAWATVDDDLKAAYLASIAEPKVFKEVDDLIKSLDDASLNDFEDLALDIDQYYFDWAKKSKDAYITKELEGLMDDPTFFAENFNPVFWKEKLLEIKDADEEAAVLFLAKFKAMKEQIKIVSNEYRKIIVAGERFAKKTPEKFMAVKTAKGKDAAFDVALLNFDTLIGKDDILRDYYSLGPSASKLKFDNALAKFRQDYKNQKDKLVASDEAEEYLTKAKEGGKGFTTHKVAYDNLSKSGGLTGDLVADAAKVKAEKDVIQASKSLAAMKTKIKKKFKANKPLAPKEQEAFDALDEVDQALLKEAASAGKTAKQLDDEAAAIVTQKAAERADEGVLFDDLKQIGDQDGSNVGGLFQSKVDGQKFYIKAPDTELAAKVEVLSSKLYQAAGVRVANVNFINLTGKIGNRDLSGRLGVTSAIEEIEDVGTSQMGALSGAKDGFAADAWLANWDVVGNGGPKQLNLKKLPDGSSFRLDTGGTLFFRAQGGRKTFSAKEVPELETLRFNTFNSGKVFGDINDDQIVAGVARIVAISDDDIRRLVNETMGDDADDLADVLIGRKSVLERTYAKQLARYNKKQKPSPLARVTKEESALIEESRINGYILPSDKLDIEDHEIRANFLKRNKKDVTQLNLRLRPEAMKRIEKALIVEKGPADLPKIDFAEMNDSIVTAIRGIMTRAKNGMAFLEKDFTRAQFALGKIADKLKELEDLQAKGRIRLDDIENFKVETGVTRDVLASFYSRYKVGDKKLDRDDLFNQEFVKLSPINQIPEKVEKKVSDEIKWIDKGIVQYYRSRFQDSFAEQTNQTFEGLGTIYETTIGGVRIKYFPDNARDSRAALIGRMEIEVDGASAASVKEGLDALDRLGIDSTRATSLDREELYLTKIFYHFSGVKRGDQSTDLYAQLFKEQMEKLSKIGSQNERVKILKEQASKAAGVKDITALPLYNASGEYQQFGHGKSLQLNPAFTGKAWETFLDEAVIYHDLEYGKGYGTQVDSFKNIIGGGGQLASTTDRFRRGIPLGEGGSETRDTASGGASYVFSRLKYNKLIGNQTGLVWKSKRHARRLDAMSYETDYYGSQRFSTGVGVRKRYSSLSDWDVSLQERAVDLKAFKEHAAATKSSNEIIFKDGLSVFEDLEVFVVRESEKKELLDFLKDKGYKKWPDGRKLEDVVLTESEAQKKYQGG